MGSLLEKNSSAVRKRIEGHTFTDEEGEEYEESAFGGFSDYFRRKKIKLQNLDAELRSASPGKPQIFKGVVAHVSGYTQPPLHILHKELVQHGAGFLQYLDSKTMATHIIASSFPPKKTVDYSKYRIVKPAWVTDSIKAGKLLPWSDYRVFDEGPLQKTIHFDGGKLVSQTSQKSPMGYREQTQNSFYAEQLQKRGSLTSPASASPAASSPAPRSLGTPPKGAGFIADGDEMDLDPLPLLDDDEQQPLEDFDGSNAAGSPPEQAEPQRGLQMGPPESVASLKDGARNQATSTKPKPMTPEEHNALLLSDPKIRKSSTANPDFLKQFYSESRLHHLSTWKAELKSKMQRLAAEKGPAVKAPRRRPGSRRYIMHVDFDSFFCAVSLKSAPEYVDKPAVVAHSIGSGSEIASCNYPARKFGVKNGMWMKRALELCPDIKVLPYDFPAYEEASRLFYESILELGGIVQSVSVDEALVDITSLVLTTASSDGMGINEGSIWREQEKADEMAINLRQQIKERTGCAVSTGVGANILLAKVALRKAKPAGHYQVKPEEVLDLLGELKVEDLPGVAYSIGGRLEEIGVRFVKDIRGVSKERLVSVLGPKTGEKLWEYSRGIDRTEVGDQPIRKSVSAEVNWGIRFISQEEAEEFVMNLCKELERRLLNEHVKGKSLTMKIMRRSADAPLDPPKHLGHGQCDVFNKSVVFGVATHDAELIGREAVSILRSFRFSPGDLRGLGVQLQKLEPIKFSTGAPDGSQKKLSFGNFATSSTTKKTRAEAIEDDSGSPQRSRSTLGTSFLGDPIADDPLTPRKPKAGSIHPALALAKANEADAKATTPLNMAGTQFIIPSNPDPAVLAELPFDIRSKLMAQQKRPLSARGESPISRSRTHSPALFDEIPPDVDPGVFAELPDDVKAEVLASYRQRAGQTLLPQSPRKDRIITAPAPKKTPTKGTAGAGAGIRGMWSKARERERQHDAEAKRVQTNFVKGSRKNDEAAAPAAVDRVDQEVEELDPDFLAELPEEVRNEVIADHRRRRLAQRSGLNVEAPPPRRGAAAAARASAAAQAVQMKLQFPPPPPKVTFNHASSLGDVKDMLTTWHRETRDEGPHRADAEALEKYLARVVVEERDMDKASRLVSWIDWLVEEDERESRGKRRWRGAVTGFKEEVQKAVRLRGLGPLSFG